MLVLSVWIEHLEISAMAVISVFRCEPVNRFCVCLVKHSLSNFTNIASFVLMAHLIVKFIKGVLCGNIGNQSSVSSTVWMLDLLAWIKMK